MGEGGKAKLPCLKGKHQSPTQAKEILVIKQPNPNCVLTYVQTCKSISPKSLFAFREKTVAKVSEETKLLQHFYGVHLSKKYYNIEL